MDPDTLDQLTSSYPDAMIEALNLQSLTTIEGYLASQLYTVGWILLAGLYFGYTGAGLIADDVDRGRMDVLLFLPISRPRLVAEKFASVLVPMHYLDPTAILMHGEYDLLAAGVLLVATIALVGASQAWFARKDVV